MKINPSRWNTAIAMRSRSPPTIRVFIATATCTGTPSAIRTHLCCERCVNVRVGACWRCDAHDSITADIWPVSSRVASFTCADDSMPSLRRPASSSACPMASSMSACSMMTPSLISTRGFPRTRCRSHACRAHNIANTRCVLKTVRTKTSAFNAPFCRAADCHPHQSDKNDVIRERLEGLKRQFLEHVATSIHHQQRAAIVTRNTDQRDQQAPCGESANPRPDILPEFRRQAKPGAKSAARRH